MDQILFVYFCLDFWAWNVTLIHFCSCAKNNMDIKWTFWGRIFTISVTLHHLPCLGHKPNVHNTLFQFLDLEFLPTSPFCISSSNEYF